MLARWYQIASDGSTPTMSYGFRHWCSAHGAPEMRSYVLHMAQVAEGAGVRELLVCHGEPLLDDVPHKLRDLAARM